MGVFRRNGSVACYLVEGRMPAPRDAAFAAALAARRFHSIDGAGSEQGAIGWVSPGDPTGDSFALEQMDGESAWWLRARADKKKLPAAWLAIHRSVAEHSRGRPLTRREARELREDLERKLLPRVLPTVKLIDVLYVPDRSRVLLFATGAGLRTEFCSLFHRTFAAVLVAADPRALALALPLEREQRAYLDQVSPVRWPNAKRATATAETTSANASAAELAAGELH